MLNHNLINILLGKLESLNEFIINYDIGLGEVIQQHESETALFGDSWAGSRTQINAGHAGLRTLHSEAGVLRAALVSAGWSPCDKPYCPDYLRDDFEPDNYPF